MNPIVLELIKVLIPLLVGGVVTATFRWLRSSHPEAAKLLLGAFMAAENNKDLRAKLEEIDHDHAIFPALVNEIDRQAQV